MNLTKRGTVWWVDFRLPTGRRVRLSTGHEDKIAASERALVLYREAHAEAGTTRGTLTLAQALDRQYREVWAKAKSERVMRCMVGIVTRHVGHWPVTEVTYAKLKDYAEGLRREGVAAATVNRRMSAIGMTLRECARRGEIVARPDVPHYAENNTKERYMTVAEEQAVLAWLSREAEAEFVRGNADKTAEWRYIHDLAQVLLDTGLRWSEVYKARRSGMALDLAHGQTKSGVGRRVPLTQRASAAWERLVANPCHDIVIRKGDHAGMSWVAHRWEMAGKANACRDVTIHILRHTCASRLVQRGVPIFTVSKWLGHSSVKVTERYAKLAPDSLSQALAALEGRPTVVERSQDTTSSQPCLDSNSRGHTATA